MFKGCINEDEVKKLYRKLAQYLHPDRGGDHALMILLNQAYDDSINAMKEKSKEKNSEQKKEEPKTSNQKYECVLEDILFREDDPRLEIFIEIKNYSKKHSKFNLSYLESVLEFAENNGFITSSQYNSLVRVYYTFRMDKEEPVRSDKKSKTKKR